MEENEKKYYTYVLLTVDNTLYCGYTDDVKARFEKHKNGTACKYTHVHNAKKLLWSKEFETKSEAMKEECKIKKMSRIQKLEYLNISL